MATNMFDDITSANIASYWETQNQLQEPYIGETLFPETKQSGRTVTWYKGRSTAPTALNPSAFDTKTINRGRNGFEEIKTDAKYFKEGKYIDEALRQQLIEVANSNNPAKRDMILKNIFDDTSDLLKGASLSREIMRTQILTTGKYHISGNGQDYVEDFGMKADHIVDAEKPWTDNSSNPGDDIEKAINTIANETGQTITRVLMNRKTFNTLLSNNTIKSTILANNANTGAVSLPRTALINYLSEEFGLSIQVYDKSYFDPEQGKIVKFIADGKVIFMPDGELGRTVMTTTPEEADLMASASADVSVVNQGVAIATTMTTDPISVQTRAAQQVTPTFEMIDSVYVVNAFNTPS